MKKQAKSESAKPPRFFVKFTEHGLCDEKGNVLYGVGRGSSKLVAPPDAPLSLMVAILEEVAPAHRYSSAEAAEKDFQRLKDYANGLFVETVT